MHGLPKLNLQQSPTDKKYRHSQFVKA